MVGRMWKADRNGRTSSSLEEAPLGWDARDFIGLPATWLGTSSVGCEGAGQAGERSRGLGRAGSEWRGRLLVVGVLR